MVALPLPIVVFVFFSSNYSDKSFGRDDVGKPTVLPITDYTEVRKVPPALNEDRILDGDNVGKPTLAPDRGIADARKNLQEYHDKSFERENFRKPAVNEKEHPEVRKTPQGRHDNVNDLTLKDITFPDNIPGGRKTSEERNLERKIIREKVMPDEKQDQNKPVLPLHTLTNKCAPGYDLDKNGVCQKTISVRSEKSFESERRRKRSPSDYNDHQSTVADFPPFEYQAKPILRSSTVKRFKTMAGDLFGRLHLDCSRMYPGLVPDGAGGCTKAINVLDFNFKKIFQNF